LIISAMMYSTFEVPELFNIAFMIFIPKDPSGLTEFGTPFYAPESTRPLSLADTFNKLVANTIRIALERVASNRISFYQRGFLKGRQVLDNVVELDFFAHICSIISPNAALVLFDFRAAFPSVSHKFLWMIMEMSGLPTQLITLIRCLYRNCTHIIRIGGKRFNGPRLLSGVRQGCPLSGLLFAIAMEPILRRISYAIGPQCSLRAYADDVGIVLMNFMLVLGSLGAAFHCIGEGTGLNLNVSKTIFIPLWPVCNKKQLTNLIREIWPAWRDMIISDRGKYLGFLLGPGSSNHIWDKALDKASKRVELWTYVFNIGTQPLYYPSCCVHCAAGHSIIRSPKVFETYCVQAFPRTGQLDAY